MTDRILTTHTGSLPRPSALAERMVAREQGKLSETDAASLPHEVTEAVATVVRRQAETGIDVVSDGEASKIGYATYVKERLTGFDGPPGALSLADLDDHPGLAERSLAGLVTGMPSCTGPVRYVGQDALRRDLENLRAALAGVEVTEAFMPAASPGVISVYLANSHYGSEEEYLSALASAMHEEYAAIVDAGFLVQIDSPDLALGRHLGRAIPVDEFRRLATTQAAAINEALRGIPMERVRLHLCRGNYVGPHHHDVPLRDILDIVLSVNARYICVEGANPRHEHEWRVFEEMALPDDRVLVPGVIDTCTNYIEHPEVVADRIVRYAEAVGRERVIAGTDCGLATFATFNTVLPAIAWAKLGSLVEGARLASTLLWPTAEPAGATR
jgi:5-methyltetrahydropteroyltriglutamate--homocysteine methyltransferase